LPRVAPRQAPALLARQPYRARLFYHLETAYAGKDSMALELASYYQRSLSSAHKRYLSAIKTLAVVRKLALPVLQVNIARKQVNVAGPVPA
jgi:hypothetical protein